jgi:Arc/MetJ-type ribon-helix-helix transcriptional regulator
MAVLTQANKQTIKRLLKTGRWSNVSEIVRYGVHLVDQECRREDPSIIPPRRRRTPEQFAEHVRRRAGTWKEKISGEELLKRTRGR